MNIDVREIKQVVNILHIYRAFQCGFPLLTYLFVGWDALAKARRGKEKNRSKKRTLTGKHLGS